MKKRFYPQNFEEVATLRKKELDDDLVKKYENYGFLDNVEENKKGELSVKHRGRKSTMG